MKKIILYTILSIMLLSIANAYTCINLTNIGDAIIDEAFPSTNAGSGNNLGFFNDTGNDERWTYIMFSNTLQGENIRFANLNVYYWNTATQYNSYIHGIDTTDYQWDEATITWNTDNLCNDNGTFGNPDICEAVYDDSQIIQGGSTWEDYNVTNTTFKQNARYQNNFSYLIRPAQDTNGNALYFYSKDYSGDTTLRPYLTVCYGEDEIPAIPVVSFNLFLNDTESNIQALANDPFNVYYYANYTGIYNLTRNSTEIANNSLQNLTLGYYEYTIKANDEYTFTPVIYYADIITTTTSTTTTSTTTTSTTTTTIAVSETPISDSVQNMGVVALTIAVMVGFIVLAYQTHIKRKGGK